jgi:hypothetical protein
LGRSAIFEVTGGDSYCFVDIESFTKTADLAANVLIKGRYPMQNVDVTIVDEDALQASRTDKLRILEETNKLGMSKDWMGTLMQQMSAWRRSFPVIDFVSRGSGRQLATYSMGPDVQSRNFNVEILARNGLFQEVLRVRRLADGARPVALAVAASYFDKRQGLVFQRISANFPTDALTADREWQDMIKLKRLKILE